jgi:hypothetical protein
MRWRLESLCVRPVKLFEGPARTPDGGKGKKLVGRNMRQDRAGQARLRPRVDRWLLPSLVLIYAWLSLVSTDATPIDNPKSCTTIKDYLQRPLIVSDMLSFATKITRGIHSFQQSRSCKDRSN